MEVSPGWRPSLSYLVHPDIASLASRPPLGISGAPLKARSRDLEAGGPRTFSGLDPGRSPTEAHTQARASRKPPEKPKRAREKHNERTGAPWVGRARRKSTLSGRTAPEQRTTETVRTATAPSCRYTRARDSTLSGQTAPEQRTNMRVQRQREVGFRHRLWPRSFKQAARVGDPNSVPDGAP